MPNLSNIALWNIWAPASAAEVESVSFVNLVENNRRTNLADKSVKDLLYSY